MICLLSLNVKSTCPVVIFLSLSHASNPHFRRTFHSYGNELRYNCSCRRRQQCLSVVDFFWHFHPYGFEVTGEGQQIGAARRKKNSSIVMIITRNSFTTTNVELWNGKGERRMSKDRTSCIYDWYPWQRTPCNTVRFPSAKGNSVERRTLSPRLSDFPFLLPLFLTLFFFYFRTIVRLLNSKG